MPPSLTPHPLLDFDPRAVWAAYLSNDHDQVCQRFLEVLYHLRDVTYHRLDRRTAGALNGFVKHFLNVMSQDDFILGDHHAERLIDLNSVIANAVAMSEFRTTDPFVKLLLGQDRNLAKLLVLFNANTSVPIDRAELFATCPPLVSRWHYSLFESYITGQASETSLQHLRTHMSHDDDRLGLVDYRLHHAYFGATYIDHERDAPVKRRINRLFQATPLCSQTIRTKPVRKRIAILTSMWLKGQSVYRSQFPFIEALAKDHDLVLVSLGKQPGEADTSLFREVRRYDASTDPSDIRVIQDNDFAMAYYPDIGMSLESIILANMRIAPIQVSNYGHPVSTHGALIDYWIGGRETEAVERAHEHYSERLVLIPGCGQAPVPLDYIPIHPQLTDTPVIAACTWSAQKINAPHLRRLRQIADRARTPVRFHFFPGGARSNGFIPLTRSITSILGEGRVQVFPGLASDQYLPALEATHFAFDCHPFGGYNSAVDLLTLRKPIVTLTGDRFYNLSTAHLLRQAGLDELATGTDRDFVDLGVRMIDDADYRRAVTRRLETIDLGDTVLSHRHVPGFVRAIDHLLEHHETLQGQSSRNPIVIE